MKNKVLLCFVALCCLFCVNPTTKFTKAHAIENANNTSNRDAKYTGSNAYISYDFNSCHGYYALNRQ